MNTSAWKLNLVEQCVRWSCLIGGVLFFNSQKGLVLKEATGSDWGCEGTGAEQAEVRIVRREDSCEE